ncbi:MAG: HlyD family efflux transporter periplasmic adaptor subunit [Lachnospiraceae bacterium]|nr:HlyD family efflux transporter periplasmic adaptor subunit [Lachnospiraceae bacterium]
MSRDLDIRIEEHRAAKRRDTIKNLIIGFLILLLVLTFFSNTWMNRTLPEVSTVYVERGGISPKIRGTGTVEADDPYKVMSKQSRKISSVLVHVGDEVSIGDVLFELEDEESEELLKAEQELRAAEKALLDTRAKYESDLFNGDVNDRVITQVRGGQTEGWDDFQKTLRNVVAQYDAADAALEAAKKKVQDLQTEQKKEIEDISSKIVQYDYELALLEQKKDLGVANEDDLKEISEIIKNKSQLTTYKTQMENGYAIKLAQVESDAADAQTAYDNAKEEKDKILTSIGSHIGLETTRTDVATAEEDVARAQERVDRLTAESIGSTITTPVSGTITSVGYVAGETTKADTPAAVIQVAGRDMIVSFSVTNAQARKVHVGDAAEPQNAWYYSEFESTLRSIKNDPNDPTGKKLLEFTIKSPEVQAGQSVSLQIGQTTQDYDLVVPNSAVRSDNNGKFVLIVDQKPSPLGNRYVARRVDAEVQESDDTNSAISAALEGYEYVITNSSEPVRAGQYVRLANETE